MGSAAGRPVPPIYQPEVAARGVIHAADHPQRKQYFVGATTAATIVANRLAPALLDRYLVKTGYDSQQTGSTERRDRPDNLWKPVDDPRGTDHGAHGGFDDKSHGRSAQRRLAEHPVAVKAAVTATVALGAAIASLGRRNGRR